MKKILFSLTIFLFTFFISSSHAEELEVFETSYTITYKISANGETLVTQVVTITNKENDILATTYTHSIRGMSVYMVEARDEKNKLDAEVLTEDDTSTIRVKLEEQVIGEGRSNHLILSYKTKDIANKIGEIWNINIPQNLDLDAIKDYKVDVDVPNTFGPKIFISPSPIETLNQGANNIYKFNKEVISNKGISASFGENQIMNYQLKYQLKNDNKLPVIQEIALPPDIKNVQQVMYTQLSPLPRRMYKDEDGNILAEYWVPRNGSLEITLTGSAKVLGRQINPKEGGKMHELPREFVSKYTISQPYWEVNSVEIQTLANDLFDAKLSVSENTKNAYDYITKNFAYDVETEKEILIERQGAVKALKNPETWACMEFTDLFISIVRAMGVPARELNGYAFTSSEYNVPLSINLRNGDLLHAWPEFFDPNFGWVSIDPTWGNTSGIDYFTKLDTNHLAFVIKGLNSEYPYPAGAYKINESDKHVQVDFAQEPVSFEEKVTISKKLPINLLKVVQGKRKYEIYNSGGIPIYNINDEILELLPFQKKSVYIDNKKNILTYQDINDIEKILKITITSTKSKQTLIKFLPQIALIFGLSVLTTTTIIFLQGKRSVNKTKF